MVGNRTGCFGSITGECRRMSWLGGVVFAYGERRMRDQKVLGKRASALICRIESIRMDPGIARTPPFLALFVTHSIFQLRLSTARFRARRAYAHGPQPPFVIIHLLVGSCELLFSRCLLCDPLFCSLILAYLPSFLLLSLRYGVGPYRHLQVIDAPSRFLFRVLYVSRFVTFVSTHRPNVLHAQIHVSYPI